MLKKVLSIVAILAGIGFLYLGYTWFGTWQWKTWLQKEFGPGRGDELAQKNALLAFGDVDLNPSDLTLAVLEQNLHQPEWKRAGDFDSTMLGWACVRERCAIRATFFVPIGQEIPQSTLPAGLIVSSPSFGDFHNIAMGRIHLGESDEKLVELDRFHKPRATNKFQVVIWDKDWQAAWAGISGKVFVLVFSNVTLQHRFEKERRAAAPSVTK